MVKNWIVNILFLFVLLKTVYRLSPDSPDHKIFWTVFYYIPEYFLTLCLFIKLYMSELNKNIKFTYSIFIAFYSFAIIYIFYSGITAKSFEDFQNRENNLFFSLIDIILLCLLLIIVITPKKDRIYGRKI